MLAVDLRQNFVLVFMTTRCVVCVQYTIEFAHVVSILYAQDDASLQQAQFIYFYSYTQLLSFSMFGCPL